jgi:Fic family protein
VTEASKNIDGTLYSYESVQDETIRAIAERVRAMRQAGRLSPEVLHHIRSYFRIKNIYHSNAIEGNVLNVGETRQVVEMGLTLTGKPLKDQAEARNLAHAIDFLEQLATHPERPILESDIRQMHAVVLKGIDDDNAGRYRSVPVEISGSAYKPPGPESVPGQMEDFARWLGTASVVTSDHASPEALIRAAVAHTWFVYIHPFIDGNGRVARLLMNLLLMRYGYPIAIITKEDRLRYYDALETSQASDLSPFLALLTECLHESLEEYERAASEQLERLEWARSLGERFSTPERIKAENEYEVWKSAMELLKSYVRQTAAMLNESATLGRVYFRDFGTLEFEKYLALRSGESVKKTWFLRVDFRSGDRAARYLFFFGYASPALRPNCDVTLHVAREEPPGSYYFERLEVITALNVPSLVEVGYKPTEERFVARRRQGGTRVGKIEEIGRQFFEEVVKVHFSN